LDSICQQANAKGNNDCEEAVLSSLEKAIILLVDSKQPGDKELKIKDEQAAINAASKVLDVWGKRKILTPDLVQEFKELVKKSSRQEELHLLQQLEEFRKEVRKKLIKI